MVLSSGLQPGVTGANRAAAASLSLSVQLMRVAWDLNRNDGITVIVATDDGEGVAEFADRAVVIHHGHIVADGGPRKVFRNWELIQGTAIRRPQVSHLAFHLLHRGLRMEPFPVTVGEASRALETLMRGGGR